MCERFTQAYTWQEVWEYLNLFGSPPNYPPRYNIAPTQLAAVVRGDKTGERSLSRMRFGLIPSWSQNVNVGYKLINARSETVTEKPSLNMAFKWRRCLIPVDGFYEWKKESGGKQPYRILPADGTILALGGLWEPWNVPEGLTLKGQFAEYQPGDLLHSFSILTTPPNEVVAPLHNRMPLVIRPDDFDTWLTGESSIRQEDLLHTYHGPMRAYAVSKEVNSPKNDNAECIEAI